MIVTRSWLNEWIDLSGITTDDLCKTLNSIGLEVDSVESYSVPKKVVFGRVLECEKHPDADKLNVCQVDIGTATRQIVCGASNVRAGLDVVVATIGAEMPGGLVIKPVKLRGVDSEGMICSASEIGLPDFAEGIMELDNSLGEYELGSEVANHPLFSDDVIEIELTANRGDCLSIMGVARDLCAAYDRTLKKQRRDEDDDNRRGIGRFLHVNHDKDLDVNLTYKVLDLKDLSLSFLIRLRLAQVNEQRERDIDKLLLYTTYSSGVILHAYDYDFFSEDGENGPMAELTLKEDEKGFASIHSSSALASTIGVKQDDASRLNAKEGRFLLEASYVSPDLISKQMALHKIESDPEFYRTSRGSEPDLCAGMSDCIELLQENSETSVFSGTIGIGNVYDDTIISLTKQDVDSIVGTDVSKVVIGKILKNLGFNTSRSSADNFVIEVPRYRHDILNKQDIIEEIVRMIGIDNIPSKAFVFEERNKLKDDYYAYKKKSVFRNRAASNGFFESVHFVFDEKKVLQKYGFETTKDELELLNPIVQTLDTLRPTLMTGLLKAASANVKNGFKQVKLFELGSVFNPLREESLKLSMLFSGDKERESLSNTGKPAKIDFAMFVQKVSDVIGAFELQETTTKHSLSHTYQAANIVIDGNIVGELFRVHPEVEKEYDLEATFLCEIDFVQIPYGLKTAKLSSKYQVSHRDLSLIIPQDLTFEKIKNVINELEIEELVSFYPVDKYSDESLGESISLSVRFALQSHEKTLEEEDITSIMDGILSALDTNLGIGLR